MNNDTSEEIIKNEETTKTFWGHLRAIVQNTHASVAIVGAEIIAEDLRAALLSRMWHLSKEEEKRLFEGRNGLLSSFSGRIDIAYALDVVSPEVRNDLNTIRTIRNKFAHSREPLHFTEPIIADLCKKLRTWDVQKTDFKEVYIESLLAIGRDLEDIAKQRQPGDSKIG